MAKNGILANSNDLQTSFHATPLVISRLASISATVSVIAASSAGTVRFLPKAEYVPLPKQWLATSRNSRLVGSPLKSVAIPAG